MLTMEYVNGVLVNRGEETTARRWVKCSSCGEQIRTGEVVIDFRPNTKTKAKYCPMCRTVGGMNETPRVGDVFELAGECGLFAMTRHGPRRGNAWTGQRCEDAPCCGCCD